MKKLTIIVMAAAMTFALTSCKDKAPQTSASEATETAAPEATPDNAEAPEAADGLSTEAQKIVDEVEAFKAKVEACKTMEDFEALSKDDAAIKAVQKTLEETPALLKELQDKNIDINIESIMDKKIQELMK